MIKVYIYNVGYYSYEESCYAQLYHMKKFTQKEFEDIVIKASISVLKDHEYVKNYKQSNKEPFKITVTFQDILFSVIEVLIEKFGFKKVNFIGKFDVFGWADILDSKDWKGERDKQLDRLTKEARKIIFK